MNEKKMLQPVIIFTAIIALLVGVWLGLRTQPKPVVAPEIYGTLLAVGKPLTPFQLISKNNLPFTEKNLHGKWSLIFIGYSHCPDICPTTLTTLQQTIELLQTSGTEIPQVIFLSIDPVRDTPELLTKYVTYFNKGFIGVTGSETELLTFSKQLATYYNKAAGASGDINSNDYLMEHSAALILINPQGELQAFLTAPHIPAQIVESVKRSVAYYQDTQ